MMKITGLSHLFKWENLHNWWLTKYFFAPLYIYIYIYSGYGRYSDPLKFFTLCYIAAICQNHLSSFFSSLMYTQHPILTEKHRIVDIFADLLKKKN